MIVGKAKMNNNQGEGKFFNGFLLGLLVGAAIVFLLGTKKGKRIWKAISEKGIDNISNLLDKANKSVDLGEVGNEMDEVLKKPSFAKTQVEREFVAKETSIEEKPRIRRFFKGISRRVN